MIRHKKMPLLLLLLLLLSNARGHLRTSDRTRNSYTWHQQRECKQLVYLIYLRGRDPKNCNNNNKNNNNHNKNGSLRIAKQQQKWVPSQTWLNVTNFPCICCHENNTAQPKTDKWLSSPSHFFIVFQRLAVV